MTKREMTSLLIKLMGIYALVQFVPGLAHLLGYIPQLFSDSLRMGAWASVSIFLGAVAGIVVWIGVCLYIIRSSEQWAKRLYPDDSAASQVTTLSFQDLQILGINFIGLMLVVGALPECVSLLYRWRFLSGEPYNYQLPSFFPDFIRWSVELAIGLYLFLRPQGLANLWTRLQGKLNPTIEKPET